MRILRVRLRNWRGVEEREVQFAPSGLTVVEGPNEAGKSSLVEALDLLFDELDSTKKREVLAVKPVHRDEGAEVEADVESGPYAFTYTKRFHKKAATTLTVSRPQPESHTGREAHERARAILDATTDVALWKALRVAQGTSLAQADVAGQRWLSAALDRAAGGASGGGAREEALFDAVRAEHDRWWTASGAPRKEVDAAEQRVLDIGTDVQKLREDVARIEADAERAAALDRDVRRLDDEVAALAARAKDNDERVQALAVLRTGAERAAHALAAAEAARSRAQDDVDRRRDLVRQCDEAVRSADEAVQTLEVEAPGLDAARAASDTAERELAAASAAAESAARDRDLRERDFDRHRDELDLAQLDERLQRVVAAERAGAAAETVVASNRCDAEHLAAVRAAHEKLLEARVRLETESPTVRVTALGACTPRIDGTDVPLAAGAAHEATVAGSTRIEIQGVLAVEVRSGAGTTKPREDFEKRRRAFEQACAAAGVAHLDAAIAAHAALGDARRALAERDRVVKENLRDLARDQLERKVTNLRERVATPAVRPAGAPPAAATFDEAQEAARGAKDAATAAAAAHEAARRRRDDLRGRHDAVHGRIRECEVRKSVLHEAADALRKRVDEARAAAADDALGVALAGAEGVHTAAAAAAAQAGAGLAAAQPDVVERLAVTARSAVDRARADRQTRHDESLRLRAALEVRGDEGLAERLGAAESALDVATLDLGRKRAQADAARLLFDTFAAERNAERSRYVAPFRGKVESLGRIVFGPTFATVVGDDLTVVSRTLDGRTVDYDSLSGGAKEQLGVVGRLACALLAADEGGVPVLLDDAFGFSDPDRLERMGILLETAARSCQVILLTCDPARARRFPGATSVSLR